MDFWPFLAGRGTVGMGEVCQMLQSLIQSELSLSLRQWISPNYYVLPIPSVDFAHAQSRGFPHLLCPHMLSLGAFLIISMQCKQDKNP